MRAGAPRQEFSRLHGYCLFNIFTKRRCLLYHTGTLAVSYGNPYLTATQKAFHARVYSQGITVAALATTAALAGYGTDKRAEHEEHDEALFQRRLAFEEAKYRKQHAAA